MSSFDNAENKTKSFVKFERSKCSHSKEQKVEKLQRISLLHDQRPKRIDHQLGFFIVITYLKNQRIRDFPPTENDEIASKTYLRSTSESEFQKLHF